MILLLAVHVPVLFWLARGGTFPNWGFAAVAAGLLVGLLAGDRAAAATGIAVGLATCSALLVALHLGGGLGHVHAGVLAALVPLYRQWRPVVAAGAVLAAGYAWGLATSVAAGEATVAVASGIVAPAALVAVVGFVSLWWWAVAERAEGRADDLAGRLEQHEGAVTQRLEDLEALKAELIAVVSHEFRTPLTSLTGYARTLAARMDQLPPSAVHQCVTGIDHHATRLARLVHNVLASDGDVAVDPHAVTDLAAVARHAAEEALGTHGSRVLVHHQLPASLRARIDLLGAHRVLGNLLDNAVKFAPGESVVRVTGRTDDGGAVVEVCNRLDRGARPDLDGMFDPFVQADSSETRGREGLGLGLHVARRLTAAHGGRLHARIRGASIVLRLVLPAAAGDPLTGDSEPGCYRSGMDPSTRRLTEFSHGAG